MNAHKIAFLNIRDNRVLPLGLLYLSAYLKKFLKEKISVFLVESDAIDDVIRSGRVREFDLIGISSMTVEYAKAIETGKKIKSAHPESVIVIGGPHISTLPNSLSRAFDIGVLGEGEKILLNAINSGYFKNPAERKCLDVIKGICYWDGGKLRVNQKEELITELDDIPIPDYDLADKKRYFSRAPMMTWGEFGIESSIITARGCPYKCIFCSTTQLWDKVRMHSPRYIAENIDVLIRKTGVSHIQFWDDLFAISKNRLQEIRLCLETKGILKKVKFNCQLRANLVDEELCRILRDCSVKIALFGFESGNDRVLEFLKGGSVTVRQNLDAIKTCVDAGLLVQGSVIFGSPTETLAEMEDTNKFLLNAIKLGADRIWSFVMTPFPSTGIWQIAKDRGKVTEDERMDWGLLSHQNADTPLLLDNRIAGDEFKSVFYKSRRILNRMKYNKIKRFLLRNPVQSLAYIPGNYKRLLDSFDYRKF